MTEPEDSSLPETTVEELSPYDPAYPMELLSNGLAERYRLADTAAQAIYHAVAKEVPMIAQVRQSLQKGFRYVVDASDETLKALDSGKIKFTTEKGGRLYAQIRGADGRYGKKLPIKREDFRRGIDPVQMANALQMRALQDQLETIIEQMHTIDQGVQNMLLGQQNDRLGMYYSGLALFLEARGVSDANLRTALTGQALRGLADATFQLTLNLQADIQYFVSGGYRAEKGRRKEVIDKRMADIHKAFAFVHQATMLRAGIYCEMGELAAMAAVLKEYSHFIEGTIAKNASLLAQCDESDDGTNAGIWQARGKYRLDVSQFAGQLTAPSKTIYLGMAREDEICQK